MEQSTDAVIALAAAVREQANAFLLKALAERGVKDLLPAHGAVLHALFRQGPLSMSALAEAIDRRKNTVTGLIKTLEEREACVRGLCAVLENLKRDAMLPPQGECHE